MRRLTSARDIEPGSSKGGYELEKLEVGTARLQIAGSSASKQKKPAEAGFRYFTRRLLLIRPTPLWPVAP
jgi:hypothetical protein